MGRRYIIKSRPHSYVERDGEGKFKNWTNRGKSQTQDMRVNAKNKVKSGYGHLGDQKKKRLNPFTKTKTHKPVNTPMGVGVRTGNPSFARLKRIFRL